MSCNIIPINFDKISITIIKKTKKSILNRLLLLKIGNNWSWNDQMNNNYEERKELMNRWMMASTSQFLGSFEYSRSTGNYLQCKAQQWMKVNPQITRDLSPETCRAET